MLPISRSAIKRSTLAATALALLAACEIEPPQDLAAERIARTMAIVDDCRASECTRLNLDSGDLDDYAITADMTHVTAYMTSYTDFDSLAAIAPMTQLRELHIGASQVSDLSGLSNFTNLTLLHAQDLRQVTDFSAISGLRNLNELALGGMDVGDLSFLRGLNRLEKLNLDYATITSFAPLRGHPTLAVLDLTDATLPADISELKTMRSLRQITVSSYLLTPDQIAVLNSLEASGVTIARNATIIVC